MTLIDAHTHVGTCQVLGANSTFEAVWAKMEQYHIQTSLVQPHPWPKEPEREHEDIANLAAKYPGRIYGMACFNPYLEEAEYERLLKWAIRDLDFRGVKIQTGPQALSPLHPACDKIFRLANELHIPVMIHTGVGIPNALPSLAIPRAMEYPELPIVLAHAGANLFTTEAIVAAQICKNIYLETSWVTSFDTIPLLQKVESERVMMGSDVPENVASELCKYESVEMTDHQRRQCMGKTAATLYRLPYEDGQ